MILLNGASQVAQTVNNLPAMWEVWVWSLVWEDPLEKRMAMHSSILAWRILWTEESGGLQSMGSQRQTRLSSYTFTLAKFYCAGFDLALQLVRITLNLTLSSLQAVPFGLGLPEHLTSRLRMSSVQFSSVNQLCPTLCNPMTHSTPGLLVHHQLPESTQTHAHWVGDAIQPSHPVLPFSSCPQSFPASGSFPMSQLLEWGGRRIGISTSTSVLPMSTQDWSPLGQTGWISLQSKGLSRVFSNNTVQKHQFFGAQLSL